VSKAKIYEFNRGDEDEFAAPAADARGHSVRLNITVPTNVSSLIAEILAKRMFPYTNMSHLVRNAINRHLKWLNGKDDRLTKDLAWMDAARAVIEKSEKIQEYASFVGFMDKHLDSLKAQGRWVEARKDAFKVVNIIVRAPSDSWQRTTLEHIHK